MYQYVDQEATLMPVDISGWLCAAELTSYDADGRLLTQMQRTRSEPCARRPSLGHSNAVLVRLAPL